MSPEQSDKHARLARGAGFWIGEERMPDPHGAPNGITAEGRSEVRMGAGGCALLTDYTQSVDGKIRMDGHTVTVWHPTENCYVMYWFDATGSPPYEFRGDYDGDVLVLEGAGPNGSRIRHRTDYPDDNTSHTVSEICFDGEKWAHIYEGTFVRAQS